jgi:sugar (pentulose or hexulose) kinase
VTAAVLAIDIGTSHSRAIAFSLEGTVLAHDQRPSLAEATVADHVTLDADALWRQLVPMIAGVVAGDLTIVAVGVTAQLGMVPVDIQHLPVGDAMLWGDRRAAAEAEEMDAAEGAMFSRLSGRRLTAESVAPRLKWMSRHRPDLRARIDRVTTLKDFVVFRLTGAFVTDETHASYSGLFDVERRGWSDTLRDLAGIERAMLPPVLRATDLAGRIADNTADATGLARGTPVAVGASDGTSGVIGAGAVRAGVTVDVAGTTDTILHTIDRPARDATGAVVLNAHPVGGLWSIGGPTGLTGGAVAWIARLLGYPSLDAAEAALGEGLAAVPPGSQGLVFGPALAGSRFPHWRPGDRGFLCGIDLSHGPAHVLRAAEEGGAFTVASGVDALRRAGVAPVEVIVVGGLSAKPGALQRRADVLGLPVRSVRVQEASAVGAAMVAAIAGGQLPDLATASDTFVRLSDRFLPDPVASQRLQEAQARWLAIASAV